MKLIIKEKEKRNERYNVFYISSKWWRVKKSYSGLDGITEKTHAFSCSKCKREWED
jgi:hypothetical protein